MGCTAGIGVELRCTHCPDRAIEPSSIPSGAAATKAEQCERTAPCSAGFWGLVRGEGVGAPKPKYTYLLAPPRSLRC